MDFKQLHESTLPKLEGILRDIFPAGKVQGREFKVGSLRGEEGESLSINLETGVWSDFATAETGGDLTSLLAAKLDYKQIDAAILIQKLIESPSVGRKELRFILGGGKPKKSKVNPESLTGPNPAYTPDHFILNEWGTPVGVWEYNNSEGRLVFVVCRYGDDSAKTYRPWTWDGYRWVCKAYDEGRPLFNLSLLSQLPNARVLIVEGEKCADVAKEALSEWFVPITWAGGAKAINKTMWSPLTGRHVVIWPDADPPGYKAASDIAKIIEKIATSIHIVRTTDLPEGSDIADLDMDGESIVAWVDANLTEHTPPQDSQRLPEGDEWKVDLQLSEKGAVKTSNHNIGLIIRNDPYFAKRWWIEEWDGKFNVLDQPAGESEVFNARMYFSKQWKIEIGNDLIYQALDASLTRKNTTQIWLTDLVWDQTPRFGILASEVLKIQGSDYVTEVMRLLTCGMVARAMKPGCKFDYCIILRGPQGIGKTLFFEKLGGSRYVMLYTHTVQDKDLLGAIGTGWVVSIEELFDTRASLRELKSMISSTTDTWRRPYHREMSSQPKRCVLVGTTDAETEFLDDMAGYRRFIIVECGAKRFNIQLFEDMREQLFAEAFHYWKTDPNWFKLSDSSAKESKAVATNWEIDDAWTEPVTQFVEDKEVITMLDVLQTCLLLPPSIHDPRMTRRVHRILSRLGFAKTRLRIQGSGKAGRLWAYERRGEPQEDDSPSEATA